jgi:hypothetical protein
MTLNIDFKKYLKDVGFNTICNFILNILTANTNSSPLSKGFQMGVE